MAVKIVKQKKISSSIVIFKIFFSVKLGLLITAFFKNIFAWSGNILGLALGKGLKDKLLINFNILFFITNSVKMYLL